MSEVMLYYSLISSPVRWTQAQYFYVILTMYVCVWCGSSSGCTLSFFLFQPPRRGKSHEEHAARKDCRTRTVPQHGWVTSSALWLGSNLLSFHKRSRSPWSLIGPLHYHVLYTGRVQFSAICSALLRYFVFVCLFVKHVNMLISLSQCCFLLSNHFETLFVIGYKIGLFNSSVFLN